MDVPIRVARVEELPPGRGKRLLLEACEVVVWNAEGRYYARTLGPARRTPAAAGCLGLTFDALAEDSPARAGGHDRHVTVTVDGDYVVIRLEATIS
jgi:hypothetical protein